MVIVKSFLKAGDDLVPVEEFTGSIADEDYIEGAIELSVDNKPILTRAMVDYVDQLWAYLTTGLDEVMAGREFSTYYPDMPLQVVLQPQGNRVKIMTRSRSGKYDADALAALGDLVRALTSEGKLFFESLRTFAPSHRTMYDRNIVDLVALAERLRERGTT